MLIRYYAGAAETAGTASEQLQLGSLSVSALRAALGRSRPDLTRVLAVSTLLIDGRPGHDPQAAVPADATVDVLPPFAGG